MTPIVVVLTIRTESSRRGKPHAAVEATTQHYGYDVAIAAASFVHGSGGTIAADLAVKVTPK